MRTLGAVASGYVPPNSVFVADPTLEPNEIVGLKQWLIADTAASFTFSTGAVVSQWNDESGQSNHVSQATVGKQPTRVAAALNGKAVVRFDGVNDLLACTYGATLTQPTTVMLVAKSAVNEEAYLFDGSTSSNRHAVFFAPTTFRWSYYAGTTVNSSTGSDTSFHVIAAIFNGTGSTLRIDGVEVSSSTPGTGTMAGITLGSNQAETLPLEGDIAEVVVWNTALSLRDMKQMEAYLANRYALTVTP